jgi:hypothetical protein
VVAFVDAFDTFFGAGEAEILRLFSATVPPGVVLFGAERWCWPQPKLEPLFPPSATRAMPTHPPTHKHTQTHVVGERARPFSARVHEAYRFLNSGQYIGRAGDVVAMLAAAAVEPADDDQSSLQTLFLMQQRGHDAMARGAIALDYHCQIFQVHAGSCLCVRARVCVFVCVTGIDTTPLARIRGRFARWPRSARVGCGPV